jgi:hypothetical protein
MRIRESENQTHINDGKEREEKVEIEVKEHQLQVTFLCFSSFFLQKKLNFPSLSCSLKTRVCGNK